MIRKRLLTMLVLLLSVTFCYATTFKISGEIYNNGDLKFIQHTGKGHFSNYVSIDVPYRPVMQVYDKLQRVIDHKIKNRGEAHITVLTPPEYNEIKKYVSIDWINKLAQEMNLQSARFKTFSVGRGSATLNGKMEYTYYITIQSWDIIRYRMLILKKIIDNGGSLADFDPFDFYGHITLGFTKRDLHITDGVVKDLDSGIIELILERN